MSSVMDAVIQSANQKVTHRFWVISDLQQSIPERATYCMTTAVDDFLSLALPIDAVCYLGDATEGQNLTFIHEMAAMQVRELAKVDAPVYYAIGNHDFDFFFHRQKEMDGMKVPFVEYVADSPQWHVQENLTDMYYVVDLGDLAIVMLTDHADSKGTWYTTHGQVRNDEAAYPYTGEHYRAVSERMRRLNKPVITMSHYAFPGGNREAPLYKQFLPLPENVRMHFYGHAHIGDAQWAGKDCYRKLSGVDDQAVMQVNVASLENYRGTAVRSALVNVYQSGEIGVLFRNHSAHCWDDLLIVREGDCLRDAVGSGTCP